MNFITSNKVKNLSSVDWNKNFKVQLILRSLKKDGLVRLLNDF